MEHKPPTQNGATPTELPRISGFVSMAVTEGETTKKNWKPVWGTNVNTPAQPYTLSFYESPVECEHGAAPVITISLKEYTTKAFKLKVADSAGDGSTVALRLGFQLSPKAMPGKDSSEGPSKMYFILPKPADANNWNVAFRDLYGSMVRKVVKRTLPVVKAAPGAKMQAKQMPNAMKSTPQQGHPNTKQQQQTPKTQHPPQMKQQSQNTQPQLSQKSDEEKRDSAEESKGVSNDGSEDSEIMPTVIVETKSGITGEHKEQNDGPFRSKRCPIPKHISKRWKQSPIAAMSVWDAAKPSMKEHPNKQFLQNNRTVVKGKEEANAPRDLPTLPTTKNSVSFSQHRAATASSDSVTQAKGASEVPVKVLSNQENSDAIKPDTVQPSVEKQDPTRQQGSEVEPANESHTENVIAKKQQNVSEPHILKSSASVNLPVKKQQGMVQAKNGLPTTKWSPSGKILVKKQLITSENPNRKSGPLLGAYQKKQLIASENQNRKSGPLLGSCPKKQQQSVAQINNAPTLKASPSANSLLKNQQSASEPFALKKTQSTCIPAKKQSMPGDSIGAKCVISKKVVAKSELCVKKQVPSEGGTTTHATGVPAKVLVQTPGQPVSKTDVSGKKTQVLVKKQCVKGQGNMAMKKAQSCKIQAGAKMQLRALPVIKKSCVKVQAKEVSVQKQTEKENIGDNDNKAKEIENEQKKQEEENKAREEKLKIEREQKEKEEKEREEQLRIEREQKEKEEAERLKKEKEEKEREEQLRIEREQKEKEEKEREEQLRIEREHAEKEEAERLRIEEQLRIEREHAEAERLRIEEQLKTDTIIMNGLSDLEDELKKLNEEGMLMENNLIKNENMTQQEPQESGLPEQNAQQPHENLSHEDEDEAGKKEPKRKRKLKMVNTGTGRSATGQGIRRVPKALLAAPLETLTEIDLSYNRLTKFPEEFYAVPGLRILNLSCNQIPTIPADIVRLSCLEVLILRVNFVEEVPPQVFMLPNLVDFTAHNCHIAKVSIPHEGPIAPLRKLALGHNRLTTLPENIGTFKGTLQRLCVDANALEQLPESIGELTLLKDLSVQDNFLATLPGSLRNLRNLEMFEAWDNCICEIPEEWVPLGEDDESIQPPFANVTEFYLQKNELVELPDWFFYMFGPRVQLIDLSANSLTTLPPLDGVPNLAALFVGANALEVLPESLPTKILACLDISRNRLRELPTLHELRELQTLNAGFNPLCAPLPALPPGVIEAILPGLGISTLPECNIPHLEILNLAVNCLSDIPAGWLGSRALRVCDISHNMLPALPPALASAYESRSDFYMRVEHNLFDLPLRSPSLWCDPEEVCPIVRIGVADTQGRRHTMEDSCTLHGDFLGDGQYDLVCMYDGHGGSKYAEAAARIFPTQLATQLLNGGDEPMSMEDMFSAAYHETNEAAAAELPAEVLQGTTALAGLLAREEGVLHIANVGDTRAVMCRNGAAVRLSEDHKNLNEGEYLRIAAAGGYVTENGRLQGVLAMSRALGDVTLRPLVSDAPHYCRVDVSPEDEFVIFACDGVWDEVSDDVAVRVVKDALEEFGGDVDKACIKLRDWAFMAGSGDNISVIVIKFDF